MDANNLTAIVGTLGFPIVMCLMFFKYIRQMTEQHKQEVKELSEAVNNNTLVMQQLIDKLEANLSEQHGTVSD